MELDPPSSAERRVTFAPIDAALNHIVYSIIRNHIFHALFSGDRDASRTIVSIKDESVLLQIYSKLKDHRYRPRRIFFS